MEVLESASTFNLTDPRVVVAGDWHSNFGWVQAVIPALRRLDPTVETVLHAGDFTWTDWRQFTESVDYWALRAPGKGTLQRFLVTSGNHEAWGALAPAFAAHPGRAIRISETVWFLPRGFRFSVHGRSVLSVGGAASVDRDSRREGVSWWPDEAILDEHVEAAIAGGPADLMITHEAPSLTPVQVIQELLETNPNSLPLEALADSEASRGQIQRIWDAIEPALLVHGHYHREGYGVTNDGRQVISLGRDTSDGNVMWLDLSRH